MKYFNVNVIEIWNYNSIRGIDVLNISIGNYSSSLFNYEQYLPAEKKDWEMMSFDLLFGKFLAIIKNTVRNYFYPTTQ